MFPGKYHQNGGFPMAMLVYWRVASSGKGAQTTHLPHKVGGTFPNVFRKQKPLRDPIGKIICFTEIS